MLRKELQLLCQILQNIKHFVKLVNLNAIGAVGEIASQITILKAFDNVRMKA